ncbi:hypothetical protein PFISCL1PPCAC_4465, partial [Pristionchus fissidentatus]
QDCKNMSAPNPIQNATSRGQREVIQNRNRIIEVRVVDDWFCAICHNDPLPLMEGQRGANCRHVFCSSCLDMHIQFAYSDPATCQLCRALIGTPIRVRITVSEDRRQELETERRIREEMRERQEEESQPLPVPTPPQRNWEAARVDGRDAVGVRENEG